VVASSLQKKDLVSQHLTGLCLAILLCIKYSSPCSTYYWRKQPQKYETNRAVGLESLSARICGQKEAFGPIVDQTRKGSDHSETLNTDVGASSLYRDGDGAVSGFVIFFFINVRVRHSTWGQNQFETVFASNYCEQMPISFSQQP
jgi:hypothetical protein